MQGQSGAGVAGEFRLVKHNVAGLRGSGPNGTVTFFDLWKRGANGEWESRFPKRVTRDTRFKNKILKRGLAYILHNALNGHAGGPFTPTDITVEPDSNPFLAFFVAGDDPTFVPTPKVGDARVNWNESDGAYDTAVPPTVATPNIGKRAILLTTTSGSGLHRLSSAYPTTNPYREVEHTFFAQANVPAYALGSVTVDSANLPADGKIFTLDDGLNPALNFEFHSTGPVTAGNIRIDTSGSPTDAQLRDRVIEAVNKMADVLFINATVGGTNLVSLAHTKGGAVGDVTITNDFTPLGSWGFTGMVGGTAYETAIDAIDNLQVKQVGLAEGVNCGDGEGAGAETHIGVRSVIGLHGVIQGISDRVYQHEASVGSLHLYTGSDDITTYGDGYVESGNQAQTNRTIASSGTDSINGTGNIVIMKNGNFTQADVGRTFTIAGSGAGNNGNKTVATVVNRIEITTVEALSTEGNGFTATVQELNTGEYAFDGDIYAQGDSGAVDLGFKWRSQAGAGPHHMGRVWATSKQIHGVRITGPAGTPKDYYLNTFKIQKLATQAQGNPSGPTTEGALQPANNNHWIDVGAEVDFTASGKATEIFDGGEEGYEFLFNSVNTTRGIRIYQAQAFVSTYNVEVAEFYIFGAKAAITLASGVDDTLKLSTAGIPAVPGQTPGTPGTYRTFALGDLSTTGDITQNDVDTIVDAINSKVRGYEIEAVRSYLGILWVRSTVTGNYVQLDLDSENNGSTANTKLELELTPANDVQKVGVTQEITKYPTDAMTYIYRVSISGDLPVAS